jgi:hypothetical protein
MYVEWFNSILMANRKNLVRRIFNADIHIGRKNELQDAYTVCNRSFFEESYFDVSEDSYELQEQDGK